MMPMVPEGSLYFWVFEQGLKHLSLAEVQAAVRVAGKELRKKDIDNYWNGWYRSDLYGQDSSEDIWTLKRAKPVSSSSSSFLTLSYEDYPMHPYLGMPEIETRWVPCNADNKPMIKWSEGCMRQEDARAMFGCKYLAENTKGTKFIVIDCDGDHDKVLDFRIISRLNHYKQITHTLSKPKKICEYEGYEDTGIQDPASFHLTFTTDRVIPTMHFTDVHMDIIGNQKNSLRYRKNKVWNGIEPAPMTPEIWEDLKRFVIARRNQSDNAMGHSNS